MMAHMSAVVLSTESLGICAIDNPDVETAAVDMEEKVSISDDDPEVRTVTGIFDNSRVSSSGEPSTVGAGALTTSAVPTAVQVSLATTRQPPAVATFVQYQ